MNQRANAQMVITILIVLLIIVVLLTLFKVI